MQIALVGAGPRNLALLERLISYAKERTDFLTIDVYDPTQIGGRVWNPDQNPLFMMNTITKQLTLFPDNTIKHGSRNVLTGPNFYEWLVNYAADYLNVNNFKNTAAFIDELARINQNKFASRAFFGVYAHWYFEFIQANLPSNSSLTFHQQAVADVQKNAHGFELTFANGEVAKADQVIMALGHSDAQNSAQEQQLADFAAQSNDRLYLAPGQPAEAALDDVPSQHNVILRGLGLSFFDYLPQLTIKRGGLFVRAADGTLVYHPSGREPHMIAGSRSGLPMHARGRNQKEKVKYQPVFFTLANLLIAAQANNGHGTFDQFFGLLKKEMAYKHYATVVSDFATSWPFTLENFLTALRNSSNLDQTAREFGLPEHTILDWDFLLDPTKHLTADDDYQQFMRDYLAADIADANLGNLEAPYAAMFDILRDVRRIVRAYLRSNVLSGEEYMRFLAIFNPWNARISVGPPVFRIEQMKALMDAGILEVAGPQIDIQPAGDEFVATDRFGKQWHAKNVVEARLTSINLSASTNPLIASLRDRGDLVHGTFTNSNGTTSSVTGAKTDRPTLQAVNAQDNVIEGLYLWGVPSESWVWFTTFIPQPDVQDQNLQDAETIAYNIFHQ